MSVQDILKPNSYKLYSANAFISSTGPNSGAYALDTPADGIPAAALFNQLIVVSTQGNYQLPTFAQIAEIQPLYNGMVLEFLLNNNTLGEVQVVTNGVVSAPTKNATPGGDSNEIGQRIYRGIVLDATGALPISIQFH
jgi:hypothetical protein